MEEALRVLGESGIPGALLIVMGVAYYRLDLRCTSVQEARVADAQKVAKEALEREEKWQGVLTELTESVSKVIERRQ